MAPDTRIRPGRATGANQETTERDVGPILADQARQLVEEARDCHPDLAAWAMGYVQGYESAVAGEVHARVLELAESMAEHRHRWIPIGLLSRRRRIARELREMAERAVPVTDSPDWPRVARPGGGSDG